MKEGSGLSSQSLETAGHTHSGQEVGVGNLGQGGQA